MSQQQVKPASEQYSPFEQHESNTTQKVEREIQSKEDISKYFTKHTQHSVQTKKRKKESEEVEKVTLQPAEVIEIDSDTVASSTKRLKTEPSASGDNFSFSLSLSLFVFFHCENLSTDTNTLVQVMLRCLLLNFVEVHVK
jgi:hypothetical protein